MLDLLLNDAKRIHDITGRPMDECKKQATDIALCVSAMKSRIVEFYFIKKDGTVRQAFGTLQEEVIKPHIKDTTNREPNQDLVTYFDTAKGQFRSFLKVNFQKFVS
ncbi:SH3 beta-barrel fold-containing protein [Prevotella sp. E2-28]|uniref:SH3 beta-barrel fold-containing protein n=1 Tax=Prevotella sp. E2-28 TaxID=2913620 RepID=UPI001EDB4AD1|nr:SH3 beta-barrel fold-containing protein [Prevotella sp. E2-28]UKK52704.1 SH3 beta-barrel fold-containing protein [Prevotella sp. E2-28]